MDWVCGRKEATLLDANCWIKERDAGREGLHLNSRSSMKFGRLLKNVIGFFLIQGN